MHFRKFKRYFLINLPLSGKVVSINEIDHKTAPILDFVNISLTGLCFQSRSLISPDDIIELNLTYNKSSLNLVGNAIWVEPVTGKFGIYQIGVALYFDKKQAFSRWLKFIAAIDRLHQQGFEKIV